MPSIYFGRALCQRTLPRGGIDLNSFFSFRDSDLEVDSDFSIESSGDECERPRFKSVLRVVRKDGKIVHERTKVPLADVSLAWPWHEVVGVICCFRYTLITRLSGEVISEDELTVTLSLRQNEPAPLRAASTVSRFQCVDCILHGTGFVTSKRLAFVHHLMEEHSSKPEENIYVFNTFSKFVAFKARLEGKLKVGEFRLEQCPAFQHVPRHHGGTFPVSISNSLT